MDYIKALGSTNGDYMALLIRQSNTFKQHKPLWRIYPRLEVRPGKHVAEVTGRGVTGDLADRAAEEHVRAFLGLAQRLPVR